MKDREGGEGRCGGTTVLCLSYYVVLPVHYLLCSSPHRYMLVNVWLQEVIPPPGRCRVTKVIRLDSASFPLLSPTLNIFK